MTYNYVVPVMDKMFGELRALGSVDVSHPYGMANGYNLYKYHCSSSVQTSDDVVIEVIAKSQVMLGEDTLITVSEPKIIAQGKNYCGNAVTDWKMIATSIAKKLS